MQALQEFVTCCKIWRRDSPTPRRRARRISMTIVFSKKLRIAALPSHLLRRGSRREATGNRKTLERRKNRMTSSVFRTGVLLAIFVCGVSVTQAQDKPPRKISWGVTSLSASNWIPWIAKDAKIYEKYGLDVELVLLRGSGQTSAAIVSGSIFGAPVALPTVMLADLSGADLVNIAHTVPGVQSKLLVRPEIKRPEDLKGKKIATS